jgi:excinuclease ABC subunit B
MSFIKRQNLSFRLDSPFKPQGDQPKAIEGLIQSLKDGHRYQTLLGVTGSGKTFTMANVIKELSRPALVIAPNKTLAAQLYTEFREFFPENKVKYFVSYYDYYQPEAYVPSTDTYIEKDSAINEEIDKMRHSATKSLLEATDVVIVASVSCIYGLGAPDEYFKMMLFAEVGERLERDALIRKLVNMQYARSDVEFSRGNFRVRGDTIDIFPSDQDSKAIRIVFFGDIIEEIREIDSISASTVRKVEYCQVFPVSHFVTDRTSVLDAIGLIRQELKEHLPRLKNAGKVLEAERLQQRTRYDMELLNEIGFCPGVENYSRHLTKRAEGEPPATLIDYFPKDLLVIIDESHITLPQLGGMFKGDRARKQTLVDYGFRLPSALDNRPLNTQEFWERVNQAIFVSATPGEFELEKSTGNIFEQVNRPTGLLDPQVIVKPAINQIDDLLIEIKKNIDLKERVLVTTLTKKMAEDLSQYLRELNIKSRYLHSEINALDRVEILRGLRKGDFDVLIGINLLREGLDLVEVSLVAILDADKEGFLRSTRSLIQTMGRAARNLNGRVILYADKITKSIKEAMDEADRRRKIQASFNEKHGITPVSIKSEIRAGLVLESGDDEDKADSLLEEIPKDPKEQRRIIERLRKEMFNAAAKKEFEIAAELRDRINLIQKALLANE